MQGLLKLGLGLRAAGDSPLEAPSERKPWDGSMPFGALSVAAGVDSSTCDSEGGATQAANATAIAKSHVLPGTVRDNFVMNRVLLRAKNSGSDTIAA
jgi:hypothetical protein